MYNRAKAWRKYPGHPEHDRNGQELKIGDRVTIAATVKTVSTGTSKSSISLNAKQVLLAEPALVGESG